MKKFKLILCLCACVLGLTACGSEEEKTLDIDTAAQLENIATTIATDFCTQIPPEEVDAVIAEGPEAMEYIFSNYLGVKVNGNALINGLKSWTSASEEIGNFVKVTGQQAAYDDQGSDIIVTLDIAGEKKDAQIEAIFEDDLNHTLTSYTTNVNYTFGEKMGKAGLNTLMGMGTVFIVLILICFIISLFKYITKIQDYFANKNKPEEVTVVADPAIAQIIEKEELTDDLELIAVITAAIAASGTSGSADDFVVRSIRRKANSQWNKA